MSKKAVITDSNDETDAFTDTTQYVEDAEGRRVKLPRRTARMEIKVSSALVRHLRSLQSDEEIKNIDWAKMTPADQGVILSFVLDKAPEAFADVCGQILDRDPETVLDDFTLESLMGVVEPFLSGPMKVLQKVIASVGLRRTAPPPAA